MGALKMGTVKVAYMNLGRGSVATDVVFEVYARRKVRVCFVEEGWVARTRSGTQSYPDYVMLGSETKGT